jgi:hypothetical protein
VLIVKVIIAFEEPLCAEVLCAVQTLAEPGPGGWEAVLQQYATARAANTSFRSLIRYYISLGVFGTARRVSPQHLLLLLLLLSHSDMHTVIARYKCLLKG